MNIKHLSLVVLVSFTTSFTYLSLPSAFAASASIEDQIAEQEAILAKLNAKRESVKEQELKKQMSDLQDEVQRLKDKDKKEKQNLSKDAIEKLSKQMEAVQKQLDEQAETQSLIQQAISKLDALAEQKEKEQQAVRSAETSPFSTATGNTLINPGPQGNVSYTQDAKNAQKNSTMVFSYAPDQLYKIYCRTGYLTDIALRKGEKISFVGGGNTSAWAINSTTVDGVPHIYIKPVVATSTTNIIITTNKRSYQLIVNTRDWYNPMVRWTYPQEDSQINLLQMEKEDKNITDRLNATDISKLHFGYTVTVKGDKKNKPEMVFDDGEKTIIRFKSDSKRKPALFIRERGHKTLSLATFKQKDHSYILDRVIDKAELRYSDTDIVTIERDA